jgi:sugar transferase (PEP-CTERM system associated)
LYDLRPPRTRKDLLLRISVALGPGCLLLWLACFLSPNVVLDRGAVAVVIVLTAASVFAVRLGLDAVWRQPVPSRRVLIVGAGDLARAVERELRRRGGSRTEVVGFVAGGRETQSVMQSGGKPLLGTSDALLQIAEETKAGHVVVAMEERRGAWPAGSLMRLRVQGVKVEDAHTALAALTGRIWLEGLRPSWFLFCQGFHRSAAQQVLKRAADVILSLAGLVLAAPLMVAASAAIKIESPGGVLYRQRRVGLRGQPFEMLKFRSMREDSEADGGPQWAIPDDPRVTRVGKYLRRFHLDELPQFLNVIRGEMSVVGPRPERPALVEGLRRTIPYYDERHALRPGITGWAQVNYGYGGSVEDSLRKVEFDLFYLKNLSLLLDARILLRTVAIVLLGRGGR